MLPSDDRYGIFLLFVFLHLGVVTGLFLLPLLTSTSDVGLDRLTDRQFGCTLVDLSEIGTRESVSVLSQEVEVDVGGGGGFPEGSLENKKTRRSVWEGNEDELIETTRTKEDGVEMVWLVSGSDNKDVLLGVHTAHLSEDLVENTVAYTSSMAEYPPQDLAMESN